MIKQLFIVGVFFIPFSDFPTLLPIGEMQHELSTYILLLIMLLCIGKSIFASESNIPIQEKTIIVKSEYHNLINKIMIIFLLIIFISLLMNFTAVFGADYRGINYRGRNAVGKFFTSILVVIYGFGLAQLTYALVKKYSMEDLIIRPSTLSVVFCFSVTIIEIFSWYGGPTDGLYSLLSKIIHAGSEASSHGDFIGGAFGWGHTEGRARSVCFEPPALANYAGFAWIWCYAGTTIKTGKQRLYYFCALLMSSSLIIAAASRTGILLLVGNCVILLLIKVIYLPKNPVKTNVLRNIVSFFIIFFLLLGISWIVNNNDQIIDGIFKSGSISNISRYSSNMTSYRMFAQSPIWGVGFGQYGFHVKEYMPGWGYLSWEIKAWLSEPMAVWPPVFSMYARFAGELGLLGLVFWVGLWFYLAHTIIKVTLRYQNNMGILLKQSYPLIISCFCVLFSGIPSDSLHFAMIWIVLGLNCHYIYETQSKVKNIQQ